MAYNHRWKTASEDNYDEFDDTPINNPKLFCTYFDYEEVREILGKNPEKITDLIDNDDDEYPQQDNTLRLIIESNPSSLLQEPDYSNCFPPAGEKDITEEDLPPLRSIDLEKLEAFVAKHWRRKTWDIYSAVKKVTYGGSVKVTCHQAREILLFCGLFGFVQRSPEESDENLLARYLQLKPVIGDVLKQQKKILLNRKETTLPFCGSKHTVKTWHPELAVIHNALEETALVKLEDCCLQVHLEPGENILALVREGNVVAFLPRFCAAEGQLILQEGSRMTANGEHTDALDLPGEDPVFLAESRRYGLMIADRNGAFLKDLLKNNFRGPAPEKPVFWLRGDLDEYGFLSERGSFLGLYPRTNWKNLFFFDISAGRGIAVTPRRKAIDADGNVLAKDAAQVSCWADRWIVLRCDGSVITDIGEIHRPDFPARAVCADDRGYWVATDNHLYRIGNEEETYDQSVEEIARSNDGRTVYGRMTDGSYLPLR